MDYNAQFGCFYMQPDDQKVTEFPCDNDSNTRNTEVFLMNEYDAMRKIKKRLERMLKENRRNIDLTPAQRQFREDILQQIQAANDFLEGEKHDDDTSHAQR